MLLVKNIYLVQELENVEVINYDDSLPQLDLHEENANIVLSNTE